MRAAPSGPAAGFIITGFLGGFTTFSAFSLDVFRLVDAGQYVMAGVYVIGTVMACLVAVFAGIALMRSFI